LTGSWQRISTTKTSITSIINVSTFGGATARDIFLWGAQLVEGTDAKPYFATTNRQDVPRLDYRNADGSLNSCPRLLLEPQRTNGIRNSTMVGAVAGSPGTAPTNWDNASMAGLTRTVVGLGTENGLQYIDLRFAGTATSTAITIWFETTTQIAAVTGQTWTNSVYTKLISGSALGYQLTIREYDSGSTTLRTASLSITPTSTLQRFTYTRTNDGTGTAFVRPSMWITLTPTATYDFTIRIAAPQMELGAYATTFIPTTTAAVTRLADAAFKTGISSLIGQTEGTLYASFLDTEESRIIAIGDGTVNNRLFLRKNSNGTVSVYLATGGSVIFFIQSTQTVISGSNKIAVRYKNGDTNVYLNGLSAISSTDTFTISSMPNLYIGTSESGGSTLKASIEEALVFKTALTNAQLEEITTL
jgi:hypothetical protein